MTKGYFFFILAGCFLLFSCQSDANKTADHDSSIPLPLQEALEAHGGLNTWQSFNTLGFTMMKDGKPEMHQIDLPSRKVKIDHEDYTLGYDGDEVWVSPNLAAFGTGSARFYHNLYFYFFAMPYVGADPGIIYEVLPDESFNGRDYDVVQIGYNQNVGDAPDDSYILYLDKETHILHLLLYTVTYYSKEKSERYNAIIYDDWMTVEGLKLPGSYKGYKYTDGQIGELRYERTFIDHYLSEIPLTATTFAKMANAEVDPAPAATRIENGIMSIDISELSLPSKREILNKIRLYLRSEFETPKFAFDHFDNDSDQKLNKAEIRELLNAADVGNFFLGLISKSMIRELDTSGDEHVDWPEFQKDVEKLMTDD